MKRIIVALLAGAMVFGAVFAVAATLDVAGGTIQAGSDSDLRCDEDGVRVDGWLLETDTGMVNKVRVHDIDADCSSNDLFVNVTKWGTKIAECRTAAGPGMHIPADTSVDDNDLDGGEVGVKCPLVPPVKAVDITDVEIFIEGGVSD